VPNRHIVEIQNIGDIQLTKFPTVVSVIAMLKASSQVEMTYRRPDRNGQRRGGARVGAGRPIKGPRRASAHKMRATVDRRQPQHVTLRLVEGLPTLRTPAMYAAIRKALDVTAKRHDFRIVHFSVQGNHLHLLVEADNKEALALGVKGFEVSAGKRINALIRDKAGRRRRGQVFHDRYHVRAISTVSETRNALCYVLNNHRHHGQRGPLLYDGKLDPYSSALFFPGWRERTTEKIHIPPGYDPPRVCSPETWLLRSGWKLAKPISCFEVPGQKRTRRTRDRRA
jgi:REP element-mobilizing transposase RayT